MGFGSEIPSWVDAAYDKKISALKKIIPDYSAGDEILIVRGEGENLDVSVINLKNQEIPENAEFYDDFWVRVNKNNKMTYISLAVYLLHEN